MADDWEDDVPAGTQPMDTSSKDDWNTDWNPTSNAGGSTNDDGGWGSNSNDDNGSRGRGRGKRTCFKCQGEGHMSKDCPSGGSSGGSRACFNCGNEGHTSRDCPEPRKPRSGGGGCHNCKQEGHMAKDCPEPRKMQCHKCGKEGHMSRECPDGGGGGGSRKCFNCNGEGHMSKDCPEPKKPRNNGYSNSNSMDTGEVSWDTSDKANDGGNKDQWSWGSGGGDDGGATNDGGYSDSKSGGGGGSGCRKCGKDGHFARECPDGGGGGGSGCRKCGKDGHFARDCTEEVLGPDGKPRPPLYKPEDLKEDDETIYSGITSGINFDRYDSIPVNVTGKDAPPPIAAFNEKIESELLLSAIEKCNYKKPTPVQKYGIPIVLAKRDLMACAQTGSGKTAAFLLPIIQDLFKDKELPDLYGKPEQTPVCVVITPTRELAIQIHTEAFKYTKGSIVKCQLLYGGTSVGHQTAQLSRGAHLLVATPGRLLDFVDKGKVSFSSLKYLILDEADRMIDQGFIPEVRRMVSNSSMPPKGQRQTLMFSATFPSEVQRLAAEFLDDNYLFLAVGMVGAANADVEQVMLKVEKYEKRQKLQEILGNADTIERTMIFVEQKKTADFLASFLSQCSYKATSIHGDRFQRQREEALADFKAGRMPILVATSVAARGLDIKDVRHVINYDLPKEIDDYVHRIGRTGRVGNIGKATSFYDPSSDKDLARNLAKVLGDAQQVVPDWLTEEIGNPGYSGSSGGNSNFGGTDIRGGNRSNRKASDNGGNDDWDSAPSSNPAPAAPSGDADESWD